MAEYRRTFSVLGAKPPERSAPSVPAPTVLDAGDHSLKQNREMAWENHKNIGALFDELVDVLARGGEDRTDIDPSDQILAPRWLLRAFTVILFDTIALSPEILAPKGGRHRFWFRKYRDSQKHWHRYAMVRAQLETGQAKFPPADNDVYERVSADLMLTEFAGGKDAIKASYVKVARAVKAGDLAGFYTAEHVHIDEFLRRADTVSIRRSLAVILQDPARSLNVICDYEELLTGKIRTRFLRTPKTTPGHSVD